MSNRSLLILVGMLLLFCTVVALARHSEEDPGGTPFSMVIPRFGVADLGEKPDLEGASGTGEESEKAGCMTNTYALNIAKTFTDGKVAPVCAFVGQGFNLKDISRAYALAASSKESKITAAQVLTLRRSGKGWGQIAHSIGAAFGNSKGQKGKLDRNSQHPKYGQDDGNQENEDGNE